MKVSEVDIEEVGLLMGGIHGDPGNDAAAASGHAPGAIAEPVHAH
jgi:hypothetical protein